VNKAQTEVERIDPDTFTSVERLAEAHARLDALGLRATGSPEQATYVDDLESRLTALGLTVHSDTFPVPRWTAQAWSLRLDTEPVVDLHVGSFIPFSGSTGQGGVSGPLSREAAPGVIGVVDIEVLALRQRDFVGLDWDAPSLPDIPPGRDLDAPYERGWLSQDLMRQQLDAFSAAGAAGVAFVLQGHAVEADHSYLLYDGVLRGIPALVLDEASAAPLVAAVDSGETATLVLEVEEVDAESRNLYVLIEGESDENVIVQSHTDGTNALEDNGPEAIIAMAEYLATSGHRPPRSILLVLSSGHFSTRTAWGLATFLRRHRDGLVSRTVAAISVEHLGALAWEPHASGYDVPGDFELGCFFASPHRGVIDVVRRALDRAEVTDSIVLRPFTEDETGESLDGTGWPGDGTVLWAVGHLPSANFIAGPGYLLTTMATLDLIDVPAMRRQSIAFLEAALELAAMPREQISAPAHPAAS
jgi:hypothetical protein